MYACSRRREYPYVCPSSLAALFWSFFVVFCTHSILRIFFRKRISFFLVFFHFCSCVQSPCCRSQMIFISQSYKKLEGTLVIVQIGKRRCAVNPIKENLNTSTYHLAPHTLEQTLFSFLFDTLVITHRAKKKHKCVALGNSEGIRGLVSWGVRQAK